MLAASEIGTSNLGLKAALHYPIYACQTGHAKDASAVSVQDSIAMQLGYMALAKHFDSFGMPALECHLWNAIFRQKLQEWAFSHAAMQECKLVKVSRNALQQRHTPVCSYANGEWPGNACSIVFCLPYRHIISCRNSVYLALHEHKVCTAGTEAK